MLVSIVDRAMKGDRGERHFLSALWNGETWSSIKKKLESTGSTWVVWWADGVYALSALEKAKDFASGSAFLSETWKKNLAKARVTATTREDNEGHWTAWVVPLPDFEVELYEQNKYAPPAIGVGHGKFYDQALREAMVDHRNKLAKHLKWTAKGEGT
jgi:hypothetical protein